MSIGFARLSIGVFLLSPMAEQALACEFTNPLAPDSRFQAAQASLLASEGVRSVFSAFEQREMGNLDAGKAILVAASAQFSAAASVMNDVVVQPDAGAAYNWEEMSEFDKTTINVSSDIFGFDSPQDAVGLYDAFLIATEKMSTIVGALPGEKPEPVLPDFAQTLTTYIALGALVTKAAGGDEVRCGT